MLVGLRTSEAIYMSRAIPVSKTVYASDDSRERGVHTSEDLHERGGSCELTSRTSRSYRGGHVSKASSERCGRLSNAQPGLSLTRENRCVDCKRWHQPIPIKITTRNLVSEFDDS